MLCQFCICYNVTLLKFLKLLNRRLSLPKKGLL